MPPIGPSVFIADDSEAAFQSEDFPLNRWSFQVSCISALCRAQCQEDGGNSSSSSSSTSTSTSSFAVFCGGGKPRLVIPASTDALKLHVLHARGPQPGSFAAMPTLKMALLAAKQQSHAKVVAFVGSEVSSPDAEVDALASSFVRAGVSLDIVVLGSSGPDDSGHAHDLEMLINLAELKVRNECALNSSGTASSRRGPQYRCLIMPSPEADSPFPQMAKPLLKTLGMAEEDLEKLENLDPSSGSDQEDEIYDLFEGLNPDKPATVRTGRRSLARTSKSLQNGSALKSSGRLMAGAGSTAGSEGRQLGAAAGTGTAAAAAAPFVGATSSVGRRSTHSGNCRFESLDSLQHLSTDGFIRSWLPSYSNVPGSVTITETGGLSVAGIKDGSTSNRFCFISIHQSKKVPKWAKVMSVLAGRVMPEEDPARPRRSSAVHASVQIIKDDSDSGMDCPPQLSGHHANASGSTGSGQKRMCSDKQKGSLSFLISPDDPSDLRLIWSDRSAESREKFTSIFGPDEDTCERSSGDGLKEEGARLVLKLSPTQTRFRAVAAGRNQVLQVESPSSFTFYPEMDQTKSASSTGQPEKLVGSRAPTTATSSKAQAQNGAVQDSRGKTSFFFWMQQSYSEDGLSGAFALAEKLQALLEKPPEYSSSSQFTGLGGFSKSGGSNQLQLGPLPLSLVMEIMKASGREIREDGSVGLLGSSTVSGPEPEGRSICTRNEERAAASLDALASDLVGEVLRSRFLEDNSDDEGFSTAKRTAKEKRYESRWDRSEASVRRKQSISSVYKPSSLVAEDGLEKHLEDRLGISSMMPSPSLDLAAAHGSVSHPPASTSSNTPAPVAMGQPCNDSSNTANDESIIFDLD